ncbi:uncharacterized protein LOC111247506 [Varroa destructor]|uniref:Kinase n=1 Tax=Varroa destructor TaxID=109461 RepID=A0A7M7JM21_VARDE|nr:uncharacterized protein LOC111247506 [Varroa destructor]
MAVVGGGATASNGPQHAGTAEKERALRAAFSFRPTTAADTNTISNVDSDSNGHHRLNSNSTTNGNNLASCDVQAQSHYQQRPSTTSTGTTPLALSIVTVENSTVGAAITSAARQQEEQLDKNPASTTVAAAVDGVATSRSTARYANLTASGETDQSTTGSPASSEEPTTENLPPQDEQEHKQKQSEWKQLLNKAQKNEPTKRTVIPAATGAAGTTAVFASRNKHDAVDRLVSQSNVNGCHSGVTTTTMPLPRSTMPLNEQIAGHRHGHGKTKLGMLRHQDGSILKPLMPNDVRANREHEFYLFLELHRKMCQEDNINSARCDDPVLHKLGDLTPRYLGVFETDFTVAITGGDHNSVCYIKLEDLCKGFQQPCIADIKIGRVTYDPEASVEKIEQSMNKYPAQWDIGYRILGMRVFEQGICHVYDADYGLQQTPKSVPEAIKTFTSANPACVPLIIDELQRIMDWFLIQKRFSFYSSSILFVYDAVELRCSVKLIDFAHVFPTKTADGNYLFGLRNLIDAFRVAATTGLTSAQ